MVTKVQFPHSKEVPGKQRGQSQESGPVLVCRAPWTTHILPKDRDEESHAHLTCRDDANPQGAGHQRGPGVVLVHTGVPLCPPNETMQQLTERAVTTHTDEAAGTQVISAQCSSHRAATAASIRTAPKVGCGRCLGLRLSESPASHRTHTTPGPTSGSGDIWGFQVEPDI